MSSLLYLLIFSVFIANCVAKLKINITPASIRFGVQINYTGSDDKYVTKKEVNIFNITDDNLKRGFRVELGKRPDDVFFNDPTTYGNIFQKFKWKEMKRNIKIKSATVYDIINENVVIKTHDYINNTTDDMMAKIIVYEGVENTIASSWSKQGVPEDDILIDIFMLYGVKNFSTVNKWRYDNYKASSLLLGSNFGFTNVGAGKTASATLTATKTILILKIVYVARLTGSIVGNYAKLYGKYHFWAPNIANIMKAAKIKNEILTTELIEIKCYTDPRLNVYDKLTGQELYVTRPDRHFFYAKGKS